MSFLDALLGRSKPVKPTLNRLFGLSTAALTLETEFDLKSTGSAALCFRPVSSGEFAQLQRDIGQLLEASAKDSPLDWSSNTDSFGYQWTVLRAAEYENLVATVHMVSRELQDSGFGGQLLAAVFQFRSLQGQNVYWMYNYKRGTYYPFVPTGNQARDNALELRLSSVMGRELEVESDLGMWYPLWGIPLK